MDKIMTIDETAHDEVLVLRPHGRLDTLSANEFQTLLLARISAGKLQLVIDFANLAFLSSAGLRALLVGAKRMQADGGTLVFCNLSAPIRNVFELSGMLTILSVVDDLPAALLAATA